MDINTIRIPSKGIRMFLGIATLMKMSNMLHRSTDCDFEQVEISQAPDGPLGPSIENSFPGVLGCVPTFSLDKGPTQSVCEQ